MMEYNGIFLSGKNILMVVIFILLIISALVYFIKK